MGCSRQRRGLWYITPRSASIGQPLGEGPKRPYNVGMDADPIIAAIQAAYHNVQAIYLFGSYGTRDEWPTSDVDIALLLPHGCARSAGSLALSEVRFTLERLLHRDVDLINLRLVSTVLQKEVISADRRIFCADAYAVDEFEMMTLSFYAKLGDERRGILEQFRETGRAYEV